MRRRAVEGLTVRDSDTSPLRESLRCLGFLVYTDLRQPGVAGSSPSTLTTSLANLIPSSSSVNGPNLAATNAVDNQGQALAARCLGGSNVRLASL